MDTEFRTKDLYEASVIYALGKKLLRLEDGSNQYWFVFADNEGSKRISDSYWAGDIEVNAKALVHSIKDLKDRVFAQR